MLVMRAISIYEPLENQKKSNQTVFYGANSNIIIYFYLIKIFKAIYEEFLEEKQG